MFHDPSLTTSNALYLTSHFHLMQFYTRTFILTEAAKPKAPHLCPLSFPIMMIPEVEK